MKKEKIWAVVARQDNGKTINQVLYYGSSAKRNATKEADRLNKFFASVNGSLDRYFIKEIVKG